MDQIAAMGLKALQEYKKQLDKAKRGNKEDINKIKKIANKNEGENEETSKEIGICNSD